MSASLSVLKPIPIADAMLVSSTAPENDHPAWSAATTYALADRVISTATHRIYESAKAGNLARDPTDINNRVGSPPWWIDVKPTNRWAMFDGSVSTQTIIASPLTVVLRPGFFNANYLGGLDAENVAITIKDAPGGTVIYSYSAALENSAPDDYYEYFFSPFNPQTDLLLNGFPPYNDAEITITLTRTSGNVKCGMAALGDLFPLGESQFGIKAKPKTYSYIKLNSYGDQEIKRGASAKDLSVVATCTLAQANAILDVITSLLDVPCVVAANDLPQYSGARTFGLIAGEMTYANAVQCEVSINVQGFK